MTTDRRVIAVDIGGTKIATACVEAGGDGCLHLSRRDSRPTRAALGGEEVLDRVLQAVEGQILLAGGPVDAVGIASAGVISPAGAVLSATSLMPGWGGINLAARVHAATGLPVAVLGDVQAHALGELRHGAGRGRRGMLVAAVGTGIGGAVILDGRLVRGAHDVAGHLGHVACPQAAGYVCSCGRAGHLEPFASGSGIADRYNRATGAGPGQGVDGAVVSDRAHRGDETARRILTTAGQALGGALASLCNVIDPQCVLLSGSVTHAGPLWLDAVHDGFARQAMDAVAGTPVLTGALGDDSALIGAAENVLRRLDAGQEADDGVWV